MLVTLAAALWAGGVAAASAGQVGGTGPQAVRLYVPFGPGGGSDASARNLQQSAARVAGQAIELVYLTADSGAAAGRAVRQAPADGRTLLLGRVGNMAILQALSPGTAVPLSEFTAVAVLEQSPLICAVSASSDIKSMRELQAAIAAAPGRLRYSTAGAGTLQNLAVRHFLALSGLPDDAARPVHFEQGSLATQALLDGAVEFSCNLARTIVPLVQSGALRGLLTTAAGRLKALPRLQNAAELGLRDMQQLQGWSALLGPPGMPPQALAHWRAVLGKVADDPAWLAATEAAAALPRIRAVPDPERYLRQQVQFYARLVTLLEARP